MPSANHPAQAPADGPYSGITLALSWRSDSSRATEAGSRGFIEMADAIAARSTAVTPTAGAVSAASDAEAGLIVALTRAEIVTHGSLALRAQAAPSEDTVSQLLNN